MNKSWLQLFPETFLWIKGNNGLLYNTHSQKCYPFTLVGIINDWCNQLCDCENLYCIDIRKDVSNEASQWLSDIQEMKFGRLISVETYPNKPVSLPPLLYLEKKTDRDDPSKNEKLLSYLHEIAFYIGGNETEHPEYYKQLYYPVYSDKTLSVNQIDEILKHTKGYNLQTVHFIGVSSLPPDQIDLFVQCTSAFEHKKTVVAKLSEVDFYFNLIQANRICNYHLTVLCHSVSEYKEAFEKVNTLQDVKYLLLLTDVDDYMEAEKENILDAVTLIPVYTGKNNVFFTENVFITEEDIRQPGLNKREIFRNQTINSNFFGKLTIMPDGEIYANPNTTALGTINDSIYNLIYKEMTSNSSWMKTRTDSPCDKCVYQWLCPPVSTYEYILKKPNLCLIQD